MARKRPEIGDTWYRFEDRRYSTAIDPEREIFGSTLKCVLRTMTVSALTPKCVWLGYFPGGKERLVKLNAYKKAYHPTKELALESFIARKTRQAQIYASRLADAREALEWAKSLDADVLLEMAGGQMSIPWLPKF